MIPIVFASGRTSRIIRSCSSTGSLSLVPVTSPTGLPSASASSAATGSVTAVKITGMSESIAALYALCALGVAMPQIISTLSETKLLAIWEAVPISAAAFLYSIVRFLPSSIPSSFSPSINPSRQLSRDPCSANCEIPIV